MAGSAGGSEAFDAFEAIVGGLDYPMIVVTASSRGEHSGCLVGFHTQCSIRPPRFLVCVSRRNHTSRVAARSEHLAVHILDEGDDELARLFGEQTGDETDKFAACSWRWHSAGVPVLTRPKAWFVGRVLDRLPMGDHVGHVLDPIDAAVTGSLVQLGFQRVKGLRPGHEA
jgi:flavin reductase (DIM6/NTAB) family NADH-FMN oxidoreductase RutF